MEGGGPVAIAAVVVDVFVVVVVVAAAKELEAMCCCSSCWLSRAALPCGSEAIWCWHGWALRRPGGGSTLMLRRLALGTRQEGSGREGTRCEGPKKRGNWHEST